MAGTGKTTGSLSKTRADFERFFCSEPVAAGVEASKATPPLNASDVKPIDLCMVDLFDHTYFQIKDEMTSIDGFNRIDPEGWGE
ncbi:hypothetical protein [Microvirga sp. VF16]|uniref:hypothetical protein n=1 Tax=Microvirga sp. VF16 TaxID=2807101 RepID=UPI00193EAF63|nr:hypothetical protein [Microvirga sp. VF16]QRM32465.1 hypothetical protein JO965_30685 [Microvirga sp. VF16]